MSAAPLLATLDACLNAGATVLLVIGLLLIKSGRREAHATCMTAAVVVSAAFLVCYLTYHFGAQAASGPVRFRGEGVGKGLYLALLLSHIVLAVVNVPLVLRTLWLAHRERWDAHRASARFAFPVWLYVSVTGVLVYLSLYVWNPVV